MRKKIQEYLFEIERQKGISILYACEAGSRVWGFPSVDSDYDVRFIYMKHPVIEHYLALNVENMRDVVEYKNEEPFDFDGWDLRKSLKLLKKCNPSLYEWLEAPEEFVYWKDADFVKMMKEVMPKYYSYPALCYHYLHMAKGNYRDYLQGEEVWRKKYFYVLRPMLAVMYLMEFNKVPPLHFEDLVEATVYPGKVYDAIRALLFEKLAGNELDIGPRIPEISDYINENLSILSNRAPERDLLSHA
jgi:predicted nucleotidyltransferase